MKNNFKRDSCRSTTNDSCTRLFKTLSPWLKNPTKITGPSRSLVSERNFSKNYSQEQTCLRKHCNPNENGKLCDSPPSTPCPLRKKYDNIKCNSIENRRACNQRTFLEEDLQSLFREELTEVPSHRNVSDVSKTKTINEFPTEKHRAWLSRRSYTNIFERNEDSSSSVEPVCTCNTKRPKSANVDNFTYVLKKDARLQSTSQIVECSLENKLQSWIHEDSERLHPSYLSESPRHHFNNCQQRSIRRNKCEEIPYVTPRCTCSLKGKGLPPNFKSSDSTTEYPISLAAFIRRNPPIR